MWPDVDLDVRQRFQFGGVGALYGHEIDMLVTPDPLRRRGLHFQTSMRTDVDICPRCGGPMRWVEAASSRLGLRLRSDRWPLCQRRSPASGRAGEVHSTAAASKRPVPATSEPASC
jgi:hypothetical protein